MTARRAWSDGGNRADVAAAAACIETDETIYDFTKKLPGGTTNMEAEYEGAILALESGLELGVTDIVLFMDNQTVVRHLNGVYKVRDERMKSFYWRCVDLGEKYKTVRVAWVKRELNKRADKLCRRTMDGKKPAKRPRPQILLAGPQKRPNPFTQ